MGKGNKFWSVLMEGTDLEEETMPGQSIVEIAGENRVLIENHLGVKGYTREKIIVAVGFGEIHVCGRCLELRRMSKRCLVILGEIGQITLNRRRCL